MGSIRKLFIQGGPGSGHHGHRGRLGKVGGSQKAGGFPGESSGDYDKVLELLKEVPYMEKLHRRRIDVIVRKLGYPEEEVESYLEKGYTFEVNGKTYHAGAEYNPRTGKIKVFDVANMSDLQLEGMLAHEIQHSKWEQYKKAYQKQFVEVNRVGQGEDESKWLINTEGSLKDPKDKKKYWAYDIQQEFLSSTGKRWERLRRTDGISAYSKAYWKQAVASGSSWDYDRAVDETLAEIARIKTGAARKGDKKAIRPIWASLYARVQKGTSSTKRNRLFVFGRRSYG